MKRPGDHSEKWILEPTTGCWLWIAACSGNERPILRIDGRTITAARFFAGCDDPMMDVHHSCKTPKCVNPQHLIVMHYKEHRRMKNTRRRWGRLGKLTPEERLVIYKEMHSGLAMNAASRKYNLPVVELHRLYHGQW